MICYEPARLIETSFDSGCNYYHRDDANHNCHPLEKSCNNGEYYDHQHLRKKKGLRISSLNINGLRSHFDELQSLIHDHRIQIFAPNETKLPSYYPVELTKIEGYQQYKLDRTAHGHGGGIS